MKRQMLYLLAAAVLTAGCAEKEAEQIPKGFGSFRLDCTATPGITDIAPNAASTRTDVIPTGDEMKLVLSGENYSGEWASVADFAQADTLFLEGPYKAAVSYGDPALEGFGLPYYEGSAEFRIDALVFDKPVQITAKIANSLIAIRTTAQFLKYFHDVKFTAATASENSFSFAPEAADYTSGTGYTSKAAYVKAATSITVNGTAKRQSQTGIMDGQAVTFEEQMLEATEARTKHTFVFDATNAGSATLDIYIGIDENGEDKYVETRILNIELNEEAIPNAPIE